MRFYHPNRARRHYETIALSSEVLPYSEGHHCEMQETGSVPASGPSSVLPRGPLMPWDADTERKELPLGRPSDQGSHTVPVNSQTVSVSGQRGPKFLLQSTQRSVGVTWAGPCSHKTQVRNAYIWVSYISHVSQAILFILFSSLSFLRYNWQKLYILKCMAWCFDICIKINDILSAFFFFLVRTRKTYCLGELQVYSTALLIIIPLFWCPQNLHILHNGNFTPFDQHSLSSSLKKSPMI